MSANNLYHLPHGWTESSCIRRQKIYRRAMRPFRALVIYLVGVLVGGTPLAPRLCGSGRLMDGWLTFLVPAVRLAVFTILPLKPASEPFAIRR
ncbi:MAG: hypothetical protein WAO02_08115 [Verrucomicrobiia bacterium]